MLRRLVKERRRTSLCLGTIWPCLTTRLHTSLAAFTLFRGKISRLLDLLDDDPAAFFRDDEVRRGGGRDWLKCVG